MPWMQDDDDALDEQYREWRLAQINEELAAIRAELVDIERQRAELRKQAVGNPLLDSIRRKKEQE